MLFKFLKYIQPIWYYNLQPVMRDSYFLDYSHIPEEVRSNILYDNSYKTSNGSLKDAAYQAWQRGIMNHNRNGANVVDLPVAIEDEYHFIRKYFNNYWSYYILFIRVITFHNPFSEVAAFLKKRTIKKIQIGSLYCEEFPSSLSKKLEPKFKGLVSVILPTLNRYKYLKDILKDLEGQNYKNFEVIIADQSDVIKEDFYTQFDLPIHLISLKTKGQWNARNTAVKLAKGDLIAFTEDDVRIKNNWIEEHLMTLETFEADISCGLFHPIGGKLVGNSTIVRFADQFASGNAMVKRVVFEKIGLFDRQFEKMRMGDGEFGLRAFLRGFVLVSNPQTVCVDVKAPQGGLREMGSWDGYRPKKLLSPRPIPSILYYYRKYYGNKCALYDLIKNVPPSVVPYKYKRKKIFLIIGSIFSFFLMPVIVFQIIYSWHLSSKMLNEGPLIDEL